MVGRSDLETWGKGADKGEGEGGAPVSVLEVRVLMAVAFLQHRVSIEGGGLEERVVEKYMAGNYIPWFVLYQVLVPSGLWTAFAVRDLLEGSASTTERIYAGLDSAFPSQTDLRVATNCDDLRYEVYRWVSYQFTHIGISHIVLNSLMAFALGIPLEGLYGKTKMFFIFNIGVVGGALNYVVFDSQRVIVGMSGGCYALIGMHVANLLMNWRFVRFRVPTLLMFLAMIGSDVWTYIWFGGEGVSVASHVGGAIAGLVLGTILCKPPRNPEEDEEHTFLHFFHNGPLCQRSARWIAVFMAVVLVLLPLTWLVAFFPPQSMFQSYGFCWQGLLYENNAYGCIRCGSKACISDLITACGGTCHLYPRVSTASCEDYGVVRHP